MSKQKSNRRRPPCIERIREIELVHPNEAHKLQLVICRKEAKQWKTLFIVVASLLSTIAGGLIFSNDNKKNELHTLKINIDTHDKDIKSLELQLEQYKAENELLKQKETINNLNHKP